jgi:hypothetical protein
VSYNPIVQRNLRNRVFYTSYTQGANPAQYNQGTFYTYDIEGNVDTLLQDYGSSSFDPVKNIMNMNGNRFKRMVYQYDLVSGKVNSVAYQPHQVDAFYHRYTYDAENRLIVAETSQDSVYWDKEARYEYYKHGPLARVVIGDKMVQGLDYAFAQILPINRYLLETRPLLDPKRDELIPGNIYNTLTGLIQELQGINPVIRNAWHIRGSVILHWLTLHNKRQVQYMAGHRYISSTEKYAAQEMGNLTDQLAKHHPFG